ncbi:MAG: ABC transporter substrate-binding protein [Chloroflexota bacterium]
MILNARLLGAVIALFALAVACAPAASRPSAPPASVPTQATLPTQGPVPTAALASTAGPRPTSAPLTGAKRGGALVAAQTSDAVSFHPFLTTDTGSSSYQGMVYSAVLWAYDPRTLEPRPEAAAGWKISEDRLTYTFTLRDDLKWSDGTPITSADYKWTFDQAIKPENKYPYVSNLQLVASYEAPDPRTVVVKLKEALAVGLEAANAVNPLPKHVWERLDWGDPSKNPQIMAPTVASGPFVLKEWKKDDHVTFVANDHYLRGKPLIDTYTLRVVPSSEIAFQMLKSGEVDYASFTPDNHAEAKKLANVTVYEWWPAAASWSYLGFNLRRPTLSDPEVRRALSHGIDRDSIAQYVMLGLARPTYSVFPPSSWVYNDRVPRYDFNPTLAKEMLEKAGWRAGPGGIRQKDGKDLTLRVLFGPNTSKTRERVATVAQQAWGDLGARVEVQGMEWGTYLNTLKSEPFDWDVCVLGWSSTLEPHWMNQVWREDAIPQLNAVGYVNKRVEQLFDQGVREFDREKRKQVYQEIQQIITTDAPYVFLTTDLSYVGVNNRVGGIEPTPRGIGHNIEQWFVR